MKDSIFVIIRIFFNVIYLLGIISGVILFIAASCLIVYAFGNGGPGDLLIWIHNPEVLASLTTLFVASLMGPVRKSRSRFYSKKLEAIDKKFQTFIDNL